jgi:hypothetical protein
MENLSWEWSGAARYEDLWRCLRPDLDDELPCESSGTLRGDAASGLIPSDASCLAELSLEACAGPTAEMCKSDSSSAARVSL